MTPDEIYAHALGVTWEGLPAAASEDRVSGEVTSGVAGGRVFARHQCAIQASERWRDADSSEQRAERAFWIKSVEGWIKDAQHWYQRYESMRRGSALLMGLLAVETLVLVYIAWRLL